MAGSADTLIETLDRRVDEIIDACTACGKCAEVCPTPAMAGIGDAPPKALASGVIDILKGDAHPADSEVWARACCGSAFCIPACPEGINPRFMLTMARRSLNERKAPDEKLGDGRASFKAMSDGVRMLSRLQLPKAVLDRINPPARRDKPASPPDIVFYTGCNLLKTPHIGLLCLDILDMLGARYEVYGGPGNCCGVLQFRAGDTPNSGRQIMTTIERFADTGAQEVIAWCPTCQIQFTEVAMPGMATVEKPLFDMNMFPVYLARRLDELRPLMTTPVNRKIALYEFPGAIGVTEAVIELLSAVSGLEVVDLHQPRAGYQMSSLETMPEQRRRSLANLLGAAEAAGVDTLCSVFHADHRELASHEDQWPFAVANYMDIIGESLGIRHDDLFKRLKLMHDADAIVAEAAETIAEHGLDLEDMRDAVLSFMLADQHLSPDRAEHPAAAE